VIGAALMAGVGAGKYASLRSAAKRFVQFDKTFQPDHNTAARHAKRFAAYTTLYEQLKPVTAALR
jgi:xylulokinase